MNIPIELLFIIGTTYAFFTCVSAVVFFKLLKDDTETSITPWLLMIYMILYLGINIEFCNLLEAKAVEFATPISLELMKEKRK